MKRSAWLLVSGLVVSFVIACGDDDDGGTGKRSESVLEALMRGVRFEDGVRREGDIAELDPAARTVELAPSEDVLKLGPGKASLMALEVEADEDASVAATLMQFEGAGSHTEVPVKGRAQARDGGSGSQRLEIENPFEVADDICEFLCNRVYTAELRVAVKLKGGAVSKQAKVAVELDCREDGDEALCEGGGGGSGSRRDAGGRDGGMSSSGSDGGGSGPGGDASVRDAGAAVGHDGGVAAGDGAVAPSGEPAPVIGPISPQSATAGSALTLAIGGSGFLDDAVAYVDGVAVPTTVLSETSVEAAVPAGRVTRAGSLAVYVENVQGDATTRSNVLYLSVAPAPGAPVIYDYSPDNGVAGDKILIIASNLATQSFTLVDANGTALEPGTLGTISWPNAGSVDTVEVTLPSDIASGPITVENALGAYRGKLFSVGYNLTRAAGTVLSSSTTYNLTGTWSTAEGGDNMLATSFFTAHGDCATLTTCTTKPWYQIAFAEAQTVGRIAMRGNREYASGYDFIRGKFEVLDGAGGVLWEGSYDLPAPDRDLDITMPAVAGAHAVKFSSLADESDEPGFSELEVFE